MIHPYIERWAKLLVNYSIELKEGELFMITGPYIALPLIKAVYREALRKGAHPYVKTGIEEISYLFFKEAKETQLEFVSPLDKFEIETINAMLHIWGTENTKMLSGVASEKMARVTKARREITEKYFERTAKGELKWCGTLYPTNAFAQDAEMSLEEAEEFVFKACFLHKENPEEEWKKIHVEQERLIEKIKNFKELRIIAKDTDLKVKIENRKWINSDGKHNMPSGEIFTSPVENATEGKVRFSFPALYRGREVEDVYLEFKEGKVVKIDAGKGKEFLEAMLSTDEGAKRLGEVAFGTNYEIKRYIKHTLFIEKIGGTMHLALGNAFEEAGGKNKSSIHWDMVIDLRKDGEVYGDGKLIFKNGKFVI